MPKRMLSEGYLTSDRINGLSLEAEMLFIRLLLVCDDHGRMDARPVVLRSKCFPLRVDAVKLSNVEKWLAELVDADLVRIYVHDEKPFLFMTKWKDHQRLRNSHAKYPDPEGEGSAAVRRELPQVAANGGESRPEARSVSEKREAKARSAPASPSRHIYPEPFEAFWTAYPRKTDKAEAFGLWQAWLDAGEKAEDLERAAKNYAAACARDGTEAKFIKLPSSFLAKERQPWVEWANGTNSKPQPVTPPRLVWTP